MFVSVQFPLADLRPFLEQTGRLDSPPWPLAEPARHFVRSLGGVRSRRRGGVSEWVGEDVYCNVRKGVQLAVRPAYLKQHGLRLLWRRMYATGGLRWSGVVARFDIGFGCRLPASMSEQSLAIAARNLAEQCLHLPASVLSAKPAALGLCGPRIARHLLASTTAHDRVAAPPSWWLQAGRPLVLVETPSMELRDPNVIAVQHLETVRLNDSRLPLWILQYQPGVSFGTLRKLRIHLWRIHQEREVLGRVLAACIQGRIDPLESRALRDYLAEQSRWLGKQKTEGFPQRDLLDYAYQLDSLVHRDDVHKLKSIMNDLGPGLMHSVMSLTTPSQPVLVHHDNRTIVYQIGGTMVTAGGQNVEASGGSNIGNVVGGDVDNSNLTSSQNVSDSWKSFTGSHDLQALAEELETLRSGLAQQATKPEHYSALAEVASAQIAASKGDAEGTRTALGKVGTWVFSTATALGVAVAAAAIKAATGL
jgi:hypothetical protein